MSSSFFPLSIHVVKGHSMQPHIKEGERVVVFRWAYAFTQPKVGDVVIFKGGDGKKYVKRITAIAGKNEFIVKGDNRDDSKKLPALRIDQIVGKVIARY